MRRWLSCGLLAAAMVWLGQGAAAAKPGLPSLNVVYLGLGNLASGCDGGARADTPSGGSLHDLVKRRILTGECKSQEVIARFRTDEDGKHLQEAGVALWNIKDDGEATAVGGRPDSVAFSFFSVEEPVLAHHRTAADVLKVLVYIPVTFHVYSFKHRLVIYSRSIVIPLEGRAGGGEDPETFARSFITSDRLAPAFANTLSDVLSAMLKGDGLRRTLELRAQGRTTDYGIIRVETPEVEVKAGWVEGMTGAPGYLTYRRLAAFGLSQNLARQTPLVPAYAQDPSLGISPQDVAVLVRAHTPILEGLTGYTIVPGNDEASGTGCSSRGSGKVCTVPDNPFPATMWSLDIRPRIKVNGSRDGSGIARDAYETTATGVYKDRTGHTCKNALVPQAPRMAFALPDEWLAQAGTRRGDAPYYNSLIKALRDGSSGLVVAKNYGEVRLETCK